MYGLCELDEQASTDVGQTEKHASKPMEDSDTQSSVTQVLPEPLSLSLADAFAGPGMKDIFLDYDGTLREFEATPELAVPSVELCEILTRLNQRQDLRIAFISGRPIAFMFEYFARYDRITLVAEHGIYICRPGDCREWELFLESTYPPPGWKDAVKEAMLPLVQKKPGSFIEEKLSTCVWHFRKCAEMDESDAWECESEIVSILRKHSLERYVRVQHGHKVIEVSGTDVTKGHAVQKLRQQWHSDTGDVITFCAGDDVSDEDMFGSVADAITVKVGRGRTSAKYFVKFPSDIRAFLRRVVA